MFEFGIVGIECTCASLYNIFGCPFNININGLWIIRVVPSNDFNFMLVITRQIENNLGSFIPLDDHIINIFFIVNQKVQSVIGNRSENGVLILQTQSV